MLCLVAESLADVEGLEETARLVLDLFLEKINRVDELLGAPPEVAQAPMEMTHLGSGIWS